MPVEDVIEAWREIENARADYEEAGEFWRGEAEEYFSSERVKDLIAKTGQPYRFNFAAVPIRSLLGRVELRSVGVTGASDPDDESGAAAEANDWLGRVFTANDMVNEWVDVMETTFVFGDAYLKVIDYADDETDLDDDLLAEVGLEIVLVNPMNARMLYDPRNNRRKRFFAERWCENETATPDKREHYVELTYPGLMEVWHKRPGGDFTDANAWELEDTAKIPNTLPVFHLRTEKPYGRPVHKDAYAPQLAINKMLITQITTSEQAGWPQRYALADDGAVLDHVNDNPDWEADDDAPGDGVNIEGVRRGGVKSNMRGGAGTMQLWTGMKEVGQFDPGDPDVMFMGPATTYVAMMAVLTDTPQHDFLRTVIPPSGESRRVAEQPLVNKAKTTIRRLTPALESLTRYLLAAGGHLTPDTVIDVRWKALYTASDTHDWQAVQLRQLCGVPTDQSLIEAGYDDRQVATWLDSTTEKMTLAQRVELVEKIAAAAGALTSATASASGTQGISLNPGNIINVLLGTVVDTPEDPA